MKRVHRGILCTGVVALVLLSLFGTGLAAARPVQKGKAADGLGEEISPDGDLQEYGESR